MQTEVESPVPLVGLGFVQKGGENYTEGQYAELDNVFISPEGTLKKRPPVMGYRHDSSKILDRIVGNSSENGVLTRTDSNGDASLYIAREYNVSLLGAVGVNDKFDKAAFEAFAALGARTRKTITVESYFEYNKLLYTVNTYSGHTVTGSVVDYRTNIIVSRHPAGYKLQSAVAKDFSPVSLVATKDETFSLTADLLKATPLINSVFIHKERLVVGTTNAIYISKATDPTKFAVVDDGFFINFPDKEIKKLVALGDSIYIVFDSSVSVLTYNTSPNVDSTVRLISDSVGGEDAVVYGDTVFMLRYSSIYTIRGTSVSKLTDLFVSNIMGVSQPITPAQLFDGTKQAFQSNLKLAAFEDGLYILSRLTEFVPQNQNKNSTRHFGFTYQGGALTLRYDLNTESFTRLEYIQPLADMLVIPVQGLWEYESLLFLGGIQRDNICVFYTNSGLRFRHGLDAPDYYSNHNMNKVDQYSNDAGTDFISHPIKIKIKLVGISPDRLKYYTKKFRAILLQAAIPSWWDANLQKYVPELELLVDAGRSRSSSFAKGALTTNAIIQEPLFGDAIRVFNGANEHVLAGNVSGYRFAAMQRANEISITLKTIESVRQAAVTSSMSQWTPILDGSLHIEKTYMEIVHISTLWTPTNKGPSGSNSSFL